MTTYDLWLNSGETTPFKQWQKDLRKANTHTFGERKLIRHKGERLSAYEVVERPLTVATLSPPPTPPLPPTLREYLEDYDNYRRYALTYHKTPISEVEYEAFLDRIFQETP